MANKKYGISIKKSSINIKNNHFNLLCQQIQCHKSQKMY